LLSPSLQRSVGKPLLDAQTAFKSGNFLEGIRLQDLAKINLQDSGVDMNSKEGELIKRMLISSGAQAKISNEFIKTQIPQDLITTSEGLNTDFSNQELDAIESRNASLGNLIKFESEVAKIYEEKITPQTKTLAEIMPSAVTATKEFAMRVNEAAKSLQGGPSMAAIEQGAQRAGAALLEIEKKIAEGSKQTGDTIAGIGPEIKDKLNTSFKEIIDALSSAKTKIDAFNANNPSEPIGAPKQ
jgi:hypothetical protein